MTDDPLIAELDATPEPGDPQRCRMCAALDEMTPERADAVRKALGSKIGSERLRTILRRHGVDVGRPAVHTHRREGHA